MYMRHPRHKGRKMALARKRWYRKYKAKNVRVEFMPSNETRNQVNTPT